MVTNIVYLLMITVTIPKIVQYPKGMKLLDMMPLGYTNDYVNLLFNTLGKEGRDPYLYYQLPIDMVYPLLFGISYSLVLAFFLKKIKSLKTPFLYFCLFPVVAGMAYYLENTGIITMLNSYPDIAGILR